MADGERDYREADAAYRAAFAAHGLDVVALPAEEIVSRIKASTIRSRIIAALDFWAQLKERLPSGDGQPLRVIAGLADDDTWRQRLRDPAIAQNREKLESVTKEENLLDQPPGNLLILSYLLDKAKARATAVQLLREAQRRYPADFWISFDLATQLAQEMA